MRRTISRARSPDHDPVPAAARVAGRGERAVRRRPRRPRRRRSRGSAGASGRRRTRAPPAGRAPPGRRRPRSGRAAPRRGRAAPSIASSTPQPVLDDVDDHLHDRAAQPHRARAADDEPRPAPAEHDRRRHHARQPRARARAPPAGFRSYSPSMLFRWIPVPGTITPEPEPVEAVSEAAFPCASTTEMCVVPRSAVSAAPSRPAPHPPERGADVLGRAEPAREPAAVEVAREAVLARAALLAHHLGEPRDRVRRFPPARSGPSASSSREPVADQHAARRRRRVRDELVRRGSAPGPAAAARRGRRPGRRP